GARAARGDRRRGGSPGTVAHLRRPGPRPARAYHHRRLPGGGRCQAGPAQSRRRRGRGGLARSAGAPAPGVRPRQDPRPRPRAAERYENSSEPVASARTESPPSLTLRALTAALALPLLPSYTVIL